VRSDPRSRPDPRGPRPPRLPGRAGLSRSARADSRAPSPRPRSGLGRLEPRRDGTIRVFLDGVEITRAIRTQEVSEAAAQISQYPDVRAAMVERQRGLTGGRGVVVEGRDTGSVVFPHAAYKFFLDADLSIRAERRQRELLKLYGEPTPLALIRQELHFRDLVDQSRPVGRLVKPRGALVIDTTHLSAQQVVRRMLQRITRARPASPGRPRGGAGRPPPS